MDAHEDAPQGWMAQRETDTSVLIGKVVHADEDCPSLRRTADGKHSKVRRAKVFEVTLLPKCQRCW